MLTDLRNSLVRLSNGGWGSLFSNLNLDPASATLKDDLLAPVPLSSLELSQIDGFGDIAPDARRLIEPGRPAQSILFHAYASPNVFRDSTGTNFTAFPTPADLDLIENVVFGLVPQSLDTVLARIGVGPNVAVVAFAREYRQAAKTVHGHHADLVFSRTGVARVGTLAARWDGPSRAYLPRDDADDPFAFRVLPCRYGAYLSVQLKGDASNFGPFKINRGHRLGRQSVPSPDEEMDFWVPVHKLFTGPDCLVGKVLDVQLEGHHINEKLKRIHDYNMGAAGQLGFESGFKPPETDSEPFLIGSGLAEFSDASEDGPGVLIPIPRPSLIAPTQKEGTHIGTRVPAMPGNGLAPSFNIEASGNAHPAPEWMHVRHRIRNDGSLQDLNEKRAVGDVVRDARVDGVRNYVAAHYTDFGGDGWIDVRVGGLDGDLARIVPAYSVLAAPDFYPFVDQSSLLDWWETQVPTRFRGIWFRPPLTLADQRSAANITLRTYGADIRPENTTPTAMLGLLGSSGSGDSVGSVEEVKRTTFLPDGAAGIYQPGWDVSTDVTENVLHLAAYGLGSPFPEDAKLCAALSAYWPGVAPDSSRSAGRRVVAPLTDKEIGLETAPAWDGILGPRRVVSGNESFIETDNFDHVDYIPSALNNRFTMVETMKVSQQDYQFRIMSTARMYRLLGDLHGIGSDLRPVYGSYRMLSFRHGRDGDADIQAAENGTGMIFDDQVCKFHMVLVTAAEALRQDANNKARWLRRELIQLERRLVVDSLNQIAVKTDDGDWARDQQLLN